MKFFLSIFLLIGLIVGCSNHKSYEEACKYFYTNMESFNRIEKLSNENNFEFAFQYDSLENKKGKMRIWFVDSLNRKTFNYYLPLNFNSSDTNFISLKERRNLKYESFKELTEILLQIKCRYALFFSEYFMLEDFEYSPREHRDTQYLKKIKGNWYHNSKEML